MKIITFVLVHIFFCAANAETLQDSAGVYKTADDFKQNNLSYITPYRLKDQWGLLNSDFDFVAQGKILLRQKNGDYKYFEPKDIYGFYNNGYKYMFVPALSKYFVAVSVSPVTILVLESTVHSNYNQSTALKLAYLDMHNVLKDLTSSNIERDFRDNKQLLDNLKAVRNRFVESKENDRQRIQHISNFIQDSLKS